MPASKPWDVCLGIDGGDEDDPARVRFSLAIRRGDEEPRVIELSTVGMGEFNCALAFFMGMVRENAQDIP